MAEQKTGTPRQKLLTSRMVLIQLDLVRRLIKLKMEYPLLNSVLTGCTSRYKTQDISLVTWFFFVYMVQLYGFPYFWSCVGNFGVVWIIQYGLQAKRPVDYDPRLISPLRLLRTDPDTAGFPSIETHMAVVVAFPFLSSEEPNSLKVVVILIIVLIGCTRVMNGVRFPSQIIGSWLTGMAGVLVGNHGHFVMKQYKVPRSFHHACVVILIFGAMVVLSLWIENNESRLIGIEKQEFLRVLSNVIETSEEGTQEVDEVSKISKKGVKNQIHQEFAKKDSFCYLMERMQRRAELEKAGQRLAAAIPKKSA